MALKRFPVPVERLNGGQPILAPTRNWWETGVTFNAAAVYLDASPAHQPFIRNLVGPDVKDERLRNGVVVLLYRARPEEDSYPITRSYLGLAVFSPELELLYRGSEPIVYPDDDPQAPDYLGVEDPRITRFGDTFYCVYCGVQLIGKKKIWTNICLARSKDLLHWEKLGAIPGDVNRYPNKDGVLFPDRVNGYYLMLHRPQIPNPRGGRPFKDMHLARSETLEGPWRDCGKVMSAFENPACTFSWVGAGSVPHALGNNRYLVIYHVGNFLGAKKREYDLAAAIFNFNNFSPDDPQRVVEKRLEHFMVPEVEHEIRGPSRQSVGNVVFTCGSYEYGDYIYIIYGGADTYTLAARVKKSELLAWIEERDLSNPFVDRRA